MLAVQVLVILIILGVLLGLVNRILPMEPWVKTVINSVVAVFVLLWLLQLFGLDLGFHHYVVRR